jgi:hypothetical protein
MTEQQKECGVKVRPALSVKELVYQCLVRFFKEEGQYRRSQPPAESPTEKSSAG